MKPNPPGKGALRHVCPVCGAASSHRWCAVHDPDRERRRQAHESRKANYQAWIRRRGAA